MIKRTLYFSNPAYLSIKWNQLIIKKPDQNKAQTVPIEDIAMILLDHQQITLTHEVIRRLQQNKAVIISCDQKHMPSGLMVPLEANHTQTEKQRNQLVATISLKKQLWQQTIIAKIRNQKALLTILDKEYNRLEVLEKRVKSGDPDNIEGQAARYYWSKMFQDFTRDQFGEPPNHLLNYGYAILRSMTARALLSSGLLPTVGIFHKNKYNAFCLADDIMEPFRPFVDLIVYRIYQEEGDQFFLSQNAKEKLLSIATMDAIFNKKKKPLMVGMSSTTNSLQKCFEGTKRKIVYPSFKKSECFLLL